MAANPPAGLAPADTLERARQVMERCDTLAAFSEETDRLTRRYGTPALRQAQDAIAGWMTAAGLATRRDAVGNLIARLEGSDSTAGTLLLGSHLDSVRDAGKYDGPLGVLVALAAVEGIQARGERPPFAIELLAFADEEGLRFGTAYLGSSAYTAALDLATLATTDRDGVPLAEAVRAFGGDPGAIRAEHPPADRLLGYLEVHIEQGPTLEAMDLPVGVVTAIAGRNQIAVQYSGEAGHAGTVAMERRRDALAAASELVLAAESLAHNTPDLVATVGQIAAEPGAANVIPGRARATIDLRHPDDDVRDNARHRLRERAEEIAARRRVDLSWDVVNDNGAVAMDPTLAGLLARAVEDAGLPVHRLPSGAGHDPVMLAAICPVAMLFVRCLGGISHNPAESVTTEDVAAAIRVLDGVTGRIAGSP
ncbi:MAG: allantoate amidohydrolase [Chloroflexota bacterium]|nr:allantoate amidohydrolase [Chloroflexota bacterium]